MRKGWLWFVLPVALLALDACNTDPHHIDQRMGQNYQYWDDYQTIYPTVGPEGSASWVGSNRGHR